MPGQPGLAGTSILELGLQPSSSEEVLLTSSTVTRHGDVNPFILHHLSLLMGSVIYSLWLERYFASKVVSQLSNSSSYLVHADRPDARCGFVVVPKQGNMTRVWEEPRSEPGWSCGLTAAPERGRAG